MGYYTSYELTMLPTKDYEKIELFRTECEGANYALDESGESNDSCRWYESDNDLKAFSKKHPEIIFILSGEGEDSGDIWKAYFKNGKMVRHEAVITFPEFKDTDLV